MDYAPSVDALAPDDAQQGQDVILAAFVHGWQHDTRSDDENLTAFRALLGKTVEYERAATAPGGKPRQVLGVLVGWRGLSDFGLGNAVADATFWGRQAAGSASRSDRCVNCSGGSNITATSAARTAETRFW
jgi:hypothetical protein